MMGERACFTGLRRVAKVCRPYGLVMTEILDDAGETPAIPGYAGGYTRLPMWRGAAASVFVRVPAPQMRAGQALPLPRCVSPC